MSDLYRQARAMGIPEDSLKGATNDDIRGLIACAQALEMAHSYMNSPIRYQYRRGNLDNDERTLYRWSMREEPHA